MKLYYDLHIHSALSPCGDDDMTPNNIVNMALLKGLDMIAVTDHNTGGNVQAVQQAAGDRLLVIPGIEVESCEEVHVVCYFPDVQQMKPMEEMIRQHAGGMKNRPDIFGHQYYMNSEDEVVGEEEGLLVSATRIKIEDIFHTVRLLGGLAVPAHIDRSSYSVISNLGFIPPGLGTTTVEITPKNRRGWAKDYENYAILSSSDAHYLGDMAEREYFLEAEKKDAQSVLEAMQIRERTRLDIG